jgi:hypothetical protein
MDSRPDAPTALVTCHRGGSDGDTPVTASHLNLPAGLQTAVTVRARVERTAGRTGDTPVTACDGSGWRSAGDLGDAGDWSVSGWERTTEDPDRLERARPQRDRRGREQDERDGGVLWRRTPTNTPRSHIVGPAEFRATRGHETPVPGPRHSDAEPRRIRPKGAERPDRIGRKKIGVSLKAVPSARRSGRIANS